MSITYEFRFSVIFQELMFTRPHGVTVSQISHLQFSFPCFTRPPDFGHGSQSSPFAERFDTAGTFAGAVGLTAMFPPSI